MLVVFPRWGHNWHGRYTILGVMWNVVVWIEVVFIIVYAVVVRGTAVVIHVGCLCPVPPPCCSNLCFLAFALKQETKYTLRGSSRTSDPPLLGRTMLSSWALW